jgi:hypothetical protein
MKKLIEVSDEGLEGLLGQQVTLLCMNYIYTGQLTGVNDKFVQLTKPKIVYETGEWGSNSWKDAQSLPNDVLYVCLSAVESFGVLK